MPDPYLGNTYPLTDCPAWDSKGNETKLTGRCVVDDYDPIDPANYVHSPFYTVCPEADLDNEDIWFTVDAYDLAKQVNPYMDIDL